MDGATLTRRWVPGCAGALAVVMIAASPLYGALDTGQDGSVASGGSRGEPPASRLEANGEVEIGRIVRDGVASDEDEAAAPPNAAGDITSAGESPPPQDTAIDDRTATEPVASEQPAQLDQPEQPEQLEPLEPLETTPLMMMQEPQRRAHVASSPPAHESLPLGADRGVLSLGDTSGGDGDGSAEQSEAATAGLSFFDSFGEFGRVLGATAVVVGVLILVLMFMKRMSGGVGGGGLAIRAGRPSGILEILGRYPVGRGQALLLLKIDRRVLLIHQTRNEMTTLSELTEHREVASILAKVEATERDRITPRFQKAMRLANDKWFSRTPQIETVDLTRNDQTRLLRSSAS